MPLSAHQKQALAWLLLASFLGGALWLLAPVLMPFVVAAVLAYALSPVVDRLCGRYRPRLLAAAVVELVFVCAALALLMLLVPILTKEIPLMREQLPLLAAAIMERLQPWARDLGIPLALDGASVKAFVLKYLNANAEEGLMSVLSSLRMGGSVAVTLIGNAVLIPVALFYLLVDWHRLVPLLFDLVPPRLRESVSGFTDEADAVLGQYLRGQSLVMLLLAVYYSAGLALFGLDLAVPIGVFTGMAICIPYVGFGIGLLLAALAAGLQFGLLKALVMLVAVYGSGQVLEGFFLTPRLVGQRIGLHPLAVIFALLAFGQLFGFIGVLVALPASAVLLVGIRRWIRHYRASPLYTG